MARVLTPQDAHVLINAVASEMLGDKATVQAVDSSSFVSVGETLLSYGTENVLNALGKVLAKRMVAARPYNAKFKLTRSINSGIYSNIVSKIKFYAQPSLGDGSTNNQLTTNLADGYDNGTNSGASAVNQWEQHQPMSVEFYHAGTSTWQDCITRYEDQIQVAFKDETSFNEFVMGFMTEKYNDIEQQKEAFDRLTLLNYMAGIYNLTASMKGSAVNLTAEYNTENGTSYSTQDLLTTYQEEFYKFFVAKVKHISSLMTNRGYLYHWTVDKTVGSDTYKLAAFTPKAKQKMYLLDEFWQNAQAQVMPGIFNPSYLDIKNFETVDYWQNINKPSEINVTPAIPDVSDPTAQKSGSATNLTKVIGVLFDEEAIMTDYQLEAVATTPLEARKRYRNTWFTFRKNAINDFTCPGVLFYMAD